VLDIGREVATIPALQPRKHPVPAGQDAPAAARAAPAEGAPAAMLLHRPVVRQLFSGSDVPQGDVCDLPADAEVGRTGVVDEYLVPRHLGGGEGADEEAVGDLDVRDCDTLFHLRQRSRVVDVSALEGDDLALADPPAREQSSALYGAGAHAGLRRQI